jgi:hypothetical protein
MREAEKLDWKGLIRDNVQWPDLGTKHPTMASTDFVVAEVTNKKGIVDGVTNQKL